MVNEGLPFSPQPEKEAKNKRLDMQDEITGVHKDPVLKKEQHKPHPDEPKKA